MKILLAGGGTLGSVNPLLAVYEEARRRHGDWEWLWVGTRRGPEALAVASLGIPYEWVNTAKFRRYFSFWIFIDPFLFAAAFLKSVLIMGTARPDIIIGAGSYVSVPVIVAAWLFRKKILIHQQDVRPSLSNTLTAWCADAITVSFPPSFEKFPKKKSELTGNPVRSAIAEGRAQRVVAAFGLEPGLPTLLVLGGSSGAAKLNQWVWKHCHALGKKANIIHITGRGKLNPAVEAPRYHQLEFVSSELPDMLTLSDVVVSRAGASTLTELSHLNKAAILVPISRSHQIDNAAYAASVDAAHFLREEHIEKRLLEAVLELLASSDLRNKLGERMGKLIKRRAAGRIVSIIEKM